MYVFSGMWYRHVFIRDIIRELLFKTMHLIRTINLRVSCYTPVKSVTRPIFLRQVLKLLVTEDVSKRLALVVGLPNKYAVAHVAVGPVYCVSCHVRRRTIGESVREYEIKIE